MTAGRSYETLAMRIFANLMQSKPLRLEHDVRVEGKTGVHQIDVLWELEFGGIRYTTLIQAKDWAKPVDQGEVLKFKAVLDDIPGQPRGVLVARNGFQAGAFDVAQKNGIKLYSLRTANTEERPRGLITWEMTGYLRRFENIVPVCDDEWFRAEARARSVPNGTQVEARFEGPLSEWLLLDEKGQALFPMSDVIRGMFPSEPSEVVRARRRHEFGSPGFLPTVAGSAVPLVKVVAVEAD
jgi:hypothetical protein